MIDILHHLTQVDFFKCNRIYGGFPMRALFFIEINV